MKKMVLFLCSVAVFTSCKPKKTVNAQSDTAKYQSTLQNSSSFRSDNISTENFNQFFDTVSVSYPLDNQVETPYYPTYSDPTLYSVVPSSLGQLELERAQRELEDLQRQLKYTSNYGIIDVKQIESVTKSRQELNKILTDFEMEEHRRKNLADPPIYSSGNYSTNPNVVQVDGYNRNNGTSVQPYYRTAPNNTISDNYSTYPNINPYTGKTGSRKN
jgi:hypothetical protein